MNTLKTLKKILTTEEILSGNYGIEKEGVRINNNAQLAQTPHPKIFGDKLENPYITTDFSESQIEIVTPTFNTIDETYDFLSYITDIVNTNLKDDEYIWTQSIPPILPDNEKDIPIAQYTHHKENGLNAEIYRKNLAKKYGTKKQLISGIHYNFSLNENIIKKLYTHTKHPHTTYREFKDNLYLKIVRNYLRYRWLVIYIIGASPAADKSFINETLNMMNYEDQDNAKYSTYATSYRNASSGYKNLVELYPRYDTVEHFIEDVNTFINKGYLSEAKELYTQIRLKPKNPTDFLNSLHKDGIKYIELRTIDINPFNKNGITKDQMQFLHILILFLLIHEESDYKPWQQEGFKNEELVAENAFNPTMKLTRNGEKITLTKWVEDIIDELNYINNTLNLNIDNTIEFIEDKIKNPENTNAQRLIKLVKDEGFIESQLNLAQKYKKQSYDQISQKKEKIDTNHKIYDTAITKKT